MQQSTNHLGLYLSFQILEEVSQSVRQSDSQIDRVESMMEHDDVNE